MKISKEAKVSARGVKLLQCQCKAGFTCITHLAIAQKIQRERNRATTNFNVGADIHEKHMKDLRELEQIRSLLGIPRDASLEEATKAICRFKEKERHFAKLERLLGLLRDDLFTHSRLAKNLKEVALDMPDEQACGASSVVWKRAGNLVDRLIRAMWPTPIGNCQTPSADSQH